jgi:hypothetical protein
VEVPNVNSLTLKQWLDEFQHLKKLNQAIMRTGQKRTASAPHRG